MKTLLCGAASLSALLAFAFQSNASKPAQALPAAPAVVRNVPEQPVETVAEKDVQPEPKRPSLRSYLVRTTVQKKIERTVASILD